MRTRLSLALLVAGAFAVIAAARLPGVRVTDRIVPSYDTDTYPTHDEKYGRGGYRAVASTNEMWAIPAQRRAPGMLVYVTNNGTTYRLGTDLSTFSPVAIGGTSTVSSVFGRSGDVVAVAGDYTALLVSTSFTPTNYTPSAANVQAHLMAIDLGLASAGGGSTNTVIDVEGSPVSDPNLKAAGGDVQFGAAGSDITGTIKTNAVGASKMVLSDNFLWSGDHTFSDGLTSIDALYLDAPTLGTNIILFSDETGFVAGIGPFPDELLGWGPDDVPTHISIGSGLLLSGGVLSSTVEGGSATNATALSVNGTYGSAFNINGSTPTPDPDYIAAEAKVSGTNVILQVPVGELARLNTNNTFTAPVTFQDDVTFESALTVAEVQTPLLLVSNLTASRIAVIGADGYLTNGTIAESAILTEAEATAAYQPLDTQLTELGGISASTGATIYRHANGWTNLGAGSAGQVLRTSGGVPAWSNPASQSALAAHSAVTNFVADLSISLSEYRLLDETNAVNFLHATNVAASRGATFLITATGGDRALTLPSSWLRAVGFPASVTNGGAVVLSIYGYGADNTNVIASAQPFYRP